MSSRRSRSIAAPSDNNVMMNSLISKRNKNQLATGAMIMNESKGQSGNNVAK